ncbi:unnamed protein product [Echinostoma caproni]|uniref:Uncharacterized protein n=1 Tax=Echinostoma caproni TaxID=27848 RepID=A0A183AZ72_9TREM|nr:unnamed protein product [Echinostoma caproni]
MNTERPTTPIGRKPSRPSELSSNGSTVKVENEVSLFTGSLMHDNWVYNSVFGNVRAQDVASQASTEQNELPSDEKDRPEGRIPAYWWCTKTGASKVAHIAPVVPQPSEVSCDTPMHWRNTPRWNIPQIEVRITGHWTVRRPRSGSSQSLGTDDGSQLTSDSVISKSASSDCQRSNKMHSMPRLRLVTDRESNLSVLMGFKVDILK